MWTCDRRILVSWVRNFHGRPLQHLAVFASDMFVPKTQWFEGLGLKRYHDQSSHCPLQYWIAQYHSTVQIGSLHHQKYRLSHRYQTDCQSFLLLQRKCLNLLLCQVQRRSHLRLVFTLCKMYPVTENVDQHALKTRLL
jgi:hypothetical protein